jgi:hypothetical protein
MRTGQNLAGREHLLRFYAWRVFINGFRAFFSLPGEEANDH